MQFFLKISSLVFCCCFLGSCAVSKYTAPLFTDMEKILTLEPGLSIQQVNTELKIKPYDIVYSHDKNKMLLIYNYRVKDRQMRLPTKTAEQIVHSEEAQREGENWYNTNYKELFALFEEDKLKSIYSEEVLSAGTSIIGIDNHLDGDGTALGGQKDNDFLFASNVYNDRLIRKNAILEEDKVAKKRKRNILYVSGAAVLLVLNLIFR